MFRVAFQERQIIRRHPFGDLQAVRPPAVADQVGHPMDEHRGLARPGPRQQQQGPLGGEDGAALFRVEVWVVQGNDLPAEAAEFQFLFGREHSIKSPSVKWGYYTRPGGKSTEMFCCQRETDVIKCGNKASVWEDWPWIGYRCVS